ncbi:MAG: hypothetical protein JOY90_16650 [Bradyrhizobium sp.]|uniref:hypothetical protein n=1 Tax=Bradyrhizobium sp. TaxID=376 RepID=UPI001D5994FD|nr:hypothetical protein [Bradyrhizobium sp.]MBV9562053.1 hypothetical protein [Bradyrhizobium sp.]
MRTARDLGSPGRDDLFGEAGATPSAPVTVAEPPGEASKQPAKRAENVAAPKETATDRPLTPPIATTACDKSAAGGVDH